MWNDRPREKRTVTIFYAKNKAKISLAVAETALEHEEAAPKGG